MGDAAVQMTKTSSPTSRFMDCCHWEGEYSPSCGYPKEAGST